jgi:hypothetical protein
MGNGKMNIFMFGKNPEIFLLPSKRKRREKEKRNKNIIIIFMEDRNFWVQTPSENEERVEAGDGEKWTDTETNQRSDPQGFPNCKVCLSASPISLCVSLLK